MGKRPSQGPAASDINPEASGIHTPNLPTTWRSGFGVLASFSGLFAGAALVSGLTPDRFRFTLKEPALESLLS